MERNLKLSRLIRRKQEEAEPTQAEGQAEAQTVPQSPPQTPPQSIQLPNPEALFEEDPALVEPQSIAPYVEIAPGVIMGWPTDADVQATLRQVPSRLSNDGPGVELDIRNCEQADWLTLELMVPWDYVLSRRMIGIGMDVACSPLTHVGLQLRLPGPDGTERDIESNISVLHPELQRLYTMITLPLAFAAEPVDTQPRVILWMTKEPKKLHFERLFLI